MAAAANVYQDKAKLFIAYNADVNRGCGIHMRALHRTVLYNQILVIVILMASAKGNTATKVLLEAHADINAADIKGWTPLMIASCNNQVSVLQIILQTHADVNLSYKLGRTPLMMAASKGHADTVDLLAASGANVDMRDKKE